MTHPLQNSLTSTGFRLTNAIFTGLRFEIEQASRGLSAIAELLACFDVRRIPMVVSTDRTVVKTQKIIMLNTLFCASAENNLVTRGCRSRNKCCTAIAINVEVGRTNSGCCDGRQVAWLDADSVPLTYEDRRVIDDTRFGIERPLVREWNLQIRDTQVDDQGSYLCSVNTDPIRNKVVRLVVHGTYRFCKIMLLRFIL